MQLLRYHRFEARVFAYAIEIRIVLHPGNIRIAMFKASLEIVDRRFDVAAGAVKA